MTDFGSIGSTNGDSSTRRQAASAASDASAAKREVMELEHALNRMRLASAAVWELVKESTQLTEDDLINKMAVLDAKDGVADGQLTRHPRPCVQCKRTVPPKQKKCIYCGAEQPMTSVFESI